MENQDVLHPIPEGVFQVNTDDRVVVNGKVYFHCVFINTVNYPIPEPRETPVGHQADVSRTQKSPLPFDPLPNIPLQAKRKRYPQHNSHWSSNDIRTLTDMYTAGKNYAEISRALGRTRRAVYMKLHELRHPGESQVAA